MIHFALAGRLVWSGRRSRDAEGVAGSPARAHDVRSDSDMPLQRTPSTRFASASSRIAGPRPSSKICAIRGRRR